MDDQTRENYQVRRARIMTLNDGPGFFGPGNEKLNNDVASLTDLLWSIEDALYARSVEVLGEN